MPKGTPLTDTELAAIKAGHAAGKSLRAIARELDRSPSVVASRARDMGLSWDKGRTAAATEAKQASNQARRAALVQRLYGRAETIMDRLEAPTFKVTAVDKDGYARTTPVASDAIPGHEERALFGMAINALAGAARLEAVDAAQTGAAEARGILGDLGAALQSAYGQLAHTGGTATADALEAELADEG